MKKPELKRKLASLIIVALMLCAISAGMVSGDVTYTITVAVTTTTVSGINYATFTATENGAAKENVDIYIDDVLSGQTDATGAYVASGLSTGSHNWEAKYGGGTVGIGKFVFFGYSISAKGTDSPPIEFNYAFMVTASRSGVGGYDAGTSGEYTQCFIDTPGIASGCYYKCKRREIRANINYGTTFSSNPSLSVSSTGYDGLNYHVGSSTWCGIVQERTDGCILKTYVYYVGYDSGWGKVDKWLPGDNAQFSYTFSGSKTGSNKVSKNDDNKYIDTISNVPNSDTSLSLTVNGVTYKGTYSVEGGGVMLWLVGNELRAAYKASPQPWSQSESGIGSVTDADVDKLVMSSSLVAPDDNTVYSLSSITVNGITVYDQDSNDLNKDPNVIEYEGAIAWMQGNELHTSMSYHPPRAFIDSISPKLTQVGQAISFSGHGEDQDKGDFITAYQWRSHKDGELSTLDSFMTSSLSPARHVIYFQVADSTPYTKPYTPLWSPEDTDSVRVNKPPNAYISSIKGTGIDAKGYPTLVLGDSITFNGVGTDTDGYITDYEWKSNIIGLLSTSKSFSISDLPIGYHTISFRVKDNDGKWSKEVAKEIIVRRTPVVWVGGWQPPWAKYLDISHNYEELDPEGNPDSYNVRIDHSNGNIISYANVLSDEIEKLKRETGAKKVDITSHSMGGLISRWYIQKGYRNDVRKFISIGSPHHGSDWAYPTELFFGILDWITGGSVQMPGLLSLIGGEGGSQMVPHSSFLKSLNGHDGCAATRYRGTDLINHDVQYSVIAGTNYITPAHKHLEIELFGIKIIDLIVPWFTLRGDSVVAVDSAQLDGAEHIEINSHGWPIDAHTNLPRRDDVRDKTRYILLDDPPPIQNIVQNSTKVSTAFQWSEPILDTIHPSENKSHNIQIDPTVTNAIFTLWGLCELNLTLSSPGGVVINQSNPNINYTKEVGYIIYEIPNPEPANWTLEVTALNVSESGCNYSIMAFMETNLFVGVGTDKKEYKPNDPIKIYAYVQYDDAPLEGAIVIAEIKKSVLPPEKISLFDDGAHDDGEANDGIYANTYDDSSVSGAYGISVNATIIKDGRVYNRRAWTTVWVELLPDLSISDSDISFSNTHPEHGDTITITAKIHNIGDADANDVDILFFDGDPAESGISISKRTIGVTAGNITNVSMPWDTIFGNHTIHVIISPFNNFLEQNYTNNHACANITVGDTEPPIANGGPDQVALMDTPVFFDGSLSTDNVGIVNYTWDIDTSTDSNGDGISDNDVDLIGVNPVLIDGYNTTGTYAVKLYVNDAVGNGPVSDTMNVSVTSEYDIEKPIAVAGSNQTVSLRTPVFFDASNSTDNFGIAGYFWDTDIAVDSDGDGITDNDIDLIGQRPALMGGYSTLGMHTVQLTIDDVAGNGPVKDTLVITVTDTVAPTTTLTIYPPTPDGLNGWYVTSPTITLISIDDTGGSGVAKVEYSFDGLSWLTYSEPFTINTKGVTTIYYKSIDNADNVETIKTVTIKIDTPPVADANGPYAGYEGSLITFNGSDSYDLDDNIIIYEWDFDGDGIYETNTYETNGTVNHTWCDDYFGNVSLRVTDSRGATDVNNTTVTVLNVPPTADAGPDQTVYAGDVVIFNGSATDPGCDNLTFEWELGDGTNATGMNTTHVYFDKGNYTVTLTVIDDDGGVGTDNTIITGNPISANVTIKPETLNLKSKGHFTASITLPESYDFANVNISTVECEGAAAVSGQVADDGRYIAKFDREDLREDLPTGETVTLTVTGRVLHHGGEADFEGSDTVRVIDKGKGK